MNRHFLFYLFLIIPTQLIAQSHWSFELQGGNAWNIPLPLTIQQKGYPDIRIAQAKYTSESLISPYYWDWRFSKWFDKYAIEFEAIHHKLYLKNKTPDIQRFGISHGFNMLTINYTRKMKYFIFRNGIGKILMHPESTIRNKSYPEGPGFDIKGYRLRGIVLNTAIARKFYMIKNRFYINLEGKITFAKGNAPIVDGIAKVNNIALQAIGGLGIDFARRHTKK